MAGAASMVDTNVGVFQSPANVSMGSVVSPTVNLTSKDQEDLNLQQVRLLMQFVLLQGKESWFGVQEL